MIVLSLLALIAIAVVGGLARSYTGRRTDRRGSAAFLGFTAALIAVVATIAYFTIAMVWLRPPSVPYFHQVAQWFVFISGWVGMISSAIAVLAGLFSRGIPRIALVVFGLVMAVIYVLGAFSNFGA